MNKTHFFCVYLQPELYAFLKAKSNHQISIFIEFLIQKYKNRLIYHKNEIQLKKASCQYQPKNKNYKRFVLRKMDTDLWKRLKELKSFTGYSISFIIRVMLEWEMEEGNRDINPILPSISIQNQGINFSNSFVPMNNYIHCEGWDRQNNRIFSIFLDFP